MITSIFSPYLSILPSEKDLSVVFVSISWEKYKSFLINELNLLRTSFEAIFKDKEVWKGIDRSNDENLPGFYLNKIFKTGTVTLIRWDLQRLKY